jgi:hypothetical protein
LICTSRGLVAFGSEDTPVSPAPAIRIRLLAAISFLAIHRDAAMSRQGRLKKYASRNMPDADTTLGEVNSSVENVFLRCAQSSAQRGSGL